MFAAAPMLVTVNNTQETPINKVRYSKHVGNEASKVWTIVLYNQQRFKRLKLYKLQWNTKVIGLSVYCHDKLRVKVQVMSH